MSSIVINHLQEQFEGAITPVVYLYLNHKEKQMQTLVNLLSSLLKQLVEHHNSNRISAEIKNLYLKAREARPQIKEIDELLRSSLKDFKRVFIVVDALDECPEDLRIELSRRLHAIRSKEVSLMVTQRAESNRTKLKLLVCDICKRHPLQIYYSCTICKTRDFDLCQDCKDRGKNCGDDSHEIFERTQVVEIDVRIPDVEIERYVSWEINNELKPGSVVPRFTNAVPLTRLGRICHEHPQLKKEIPQQIVAKANGMILMAWLYMDLLKAKQNLKQIEDALSKLSSLPPEIDAIYDEVMNRIDDQRPSDSSLARRVLSWIVYTHRPLSLVELQHALAVSDTDVEFNRASIYDKQLLLSITVGLVIVDADGLAVRLTHYTAQEYFDKNREKYFPRTAAEVARVTLTYLSFRSLSEPCQSIREDQELDARLRERPFLSYASQYWGEHVLEAGSDPTIQDAVLQFVNEPGRVASTIQAAWYMDKTGSSGWDVRKDVNSLHVCAWFGLDAAVRELVKRGLDVDSRDKIYNQTALMYACKRGHVTTVRTLLELKASVKVISTRESTPMFEAIQGHHLEVGRVLLEVEDLPVNDFQPRLLCRTALMLAAGGRWEDMVDALLERQDIDVNLKDRGGSTALSIAAEAGYDWVIDSLLGKRDVDVNSVNQAGSSALILAARKGHKAIVWNLLKAGADSEITDGEGGGTALLRAVDNGHFGVVTALLNEGANVNSLDSRGRSLLHSASLNGNERIVRVLVEKGLDSSIPDRCGRTPLHDSARAGKIDVTKTLLELGANRSLEDCYGRIPHEVARQHGQRRIMLILEGKEDITNEEVANLGPIPDAETLPIWSLAKLGMKSLIEKAVAQESKDITERDPDSNDTALHWAVSANHPEILQLLLDTTNLSPSAVNDYLRTPLHLAAIHRNLLVTTILLSLPPTRTAPVFLDLPDQWGETALIMASVSHSSYPLAIALIAAGATIETRKLTIQPLFFAAVDLGNVDAVEKLIHAGADSLAKSSEGLTGLQMAKEAGHGQMIAFLQRNKSFFRPLRTDSERSRESGRNGDGESSVGSTPSVTPGSTPVVSPRPEMGARKASFAFRPRPGQVGS